MRIRKGPRIRVGISACLLGQEVRYDGGHKRCRPMTDTLGRIFVWAAYPTTGVEELLWVGEDSDLATGGTLATGKIGFYDVETGVSACTRNNDNFAAWAPANDVVAYALQDVKISTRGHFRRSADGVGHRLVIFLPLADTKPRPSGTAPGRLGRGVPTGRRASHSRHLAAVRG